MTDRSAAKAVSVKYCPTGEMIADFFTRLLQGILFRKFQNFIMNIDPVTNCLQDHRSVLRKAQVPQGSDGDMTDKVTSTTEPVANVNE